MQQVSRFTGTVEAFARLDVTSVAQWIASIPFSEWDQQHPSQPSQLRPAMMTNLDWHGFGAQTDDIIKTLLQKLPGCTSYQHMLSVVMPGDDIPIHVDVQASYWLGRVHVPLLSNAQSAFWVGGEKHALVPGTAYLVNTLALHGVTNEGATPRIHFMFDIRG